MKSILAISKKILLCVLFSCTLISTNVLAQNSKKTFGVYSFNSKISLGYISVDRASDISFLGTEGKWVNVRFRGGVPAWMKLADVAVLGNNEVRVVSNKARIYILPKDKSRYLMTVTKGFTSKVLAVRNSWYQVSTPEYLTMKMLASEYKLVTKNRNRQVNVVTRSEEVINGNEFDSINEFVGNNELTNSAELVTDEPITINNDAVIGDEIQTPGVSALIEPEAQLVSQNQDINSSQVEKTISPSNSITAPRSAYFLTPGDVVSISVFGEPDMTLTNQRIGESGYVSFPLIGQIAIKGKTTQEVESMIASRLSKGYLRDPKVNVVINAYRPLYVRGAVNTPGSYDYTEGLSVAKVLTLAGGVTKGAVTDTLKLFRNDEIFLQNLTINSQILIEPGDILTVEERLGSVDKASSFIYLHGEVNTPGSYEYRQGLTVEKAVALAGGFSPRASRRKIDISRESLEQEEPEKIKKVKLFHALKPGDVIHVGASWF